MAKRKCTIPRSVQSISLTWQDAHIRHRFSDFSVRRYKGEIVWGGGLQPNLTSPIYQIEIRYRLREVPKVRVIAPPLAPKAPHLYSNGTLCLYWPKEWRWRQDQLIADTIIPWAATWLYYYELWLDTDKWLGPSSHDRQD